MITVSAPAKSGYRAEYETLDAARADAANLLDVPVADMVEVESPDGGTTYCYASQGEADADQDGAYAVWYREEPTCSKCGAPSPASEPDGGQNYQHGANCECGGGCDLCHDAIIEVQEFVAAYEDDDEIPDSELERVFRLAYGRAADNEDRSTGLWSLICASV